MFSMLKVPEGLLCISLVFIVWLSQQFIGVGGEGGISGRAINP